MGSTVLRSGDGVLDTPWTRGPGRVAARGSFQGEAAVARLIRCNAGQLVESTLRGERACAGLADRNIKRWPVTMTMEELVALAFKRAQK